MTRDADIEFAEAMEISTEHIQPVVTKLLDNKMYNPQLIFISLLFNTIVLGKSIGYSEGEIVGVMNLLYPDDK